MYVLGPNSQNPKDTPLPFFYANAKDGGLGIQCLKFIIPAHKTKRLLNLQCSDDPVMEKIEALDNFKRKTSLNGANPPWFSIIAINWRGCFSPMAAKDLRNIGFTERDLGFLSEITMEQAEFYIVSSMRVQCELEDETVWTYV